MSALDPGVHHGFAVTGSRKGDITYRRALRHSRKVRLLRWAIPVLVVLMLGGAAAVRFFDPMQVLTRLPLSSQGLVISGSKITMAAPKLSGYTSDSRRYEMTAESAAQDVTKPSVIELNVIRARVEATDKSMMNISAASGLYDRSSGMLTLNRNVKLTSDAGYDIRLDEAVINTVTSHIVSDKPVEVHTQDSIIKANKLEVLNGGEVVVFSGDVNVQMLAAKAPAASTPAGKP